MFCKQKFPVHAIVAHNGKVVKCTLVQKMRPCTGRTAHRGSRGIALLVLDDGTRSGWGVSVTPQPLLPPGESRYRLYRRLGGPQGRSGQVRKNLAPTGIRSTDRPARSQSLYRLRYLPHNRGIWGNNILQIILEKLQIMNRQWLRWKTS